METNHAHPATVCPKCAYARKATDAAPEWQCPACGIVYAKFGTVPHGHAHNLDAAGLALPSAPRSVAQTAPPPPPESEEDDPDETDDSTLPARLLQARWIEGALTGAVIVLSFAWSFFMERRTYAYTLLALPWIAIALVALAGKWFTFRMIDREKHESARASVAPAMLFASLAILYFADRYHPVRDSSAVWNYALGGALVMTVIATAVSASLRWRWPGLLGMFIKTGMYSAAAAMVVNSLLDHAVAPFEILQIDSKHVSTQRDGGRAAKLRHIFQTHYVSDPADSTTVYVSPGWFEQKNPGDLICRYRHPGYLGMQWTFVSECRKSAMSDRKEQLRQHAFEYVAETLALNRMQDEGFRMRVNMRITRRLEEIKGTESDTLMEKIAQECMQQEGFEFVDDK